LAAARTFTIAAIIDASHSFADTLEPREIAALEGDEQFTVLSDRAEIAFIFGVTQHVTSVIFFKGPSSELWGTLNEHLLARLRGGR
jgi:hypothetical protein